MTATIVTGSQGVFWRPSASAAPALRVAPGLRSQNRLAAAVLALICAFTLILAAAPTASSLNLLGTETGIAAQTDPAHAFAGAETAASPAFVGGNGPFGYDGMSGCCVAPRVADELLGAACSFSGDTYVLMADGTTKPIEDVEVGDWVLAEDPETGERGARQVTHLWIHEDTIIDLEIGGHDIATTEDHPFWNETDSEWQRADVLDPGDLVLTADGATLTVDGMDWASARTTTAYNLTVDDIHTYFVGAGDDEVLVHNTNGCNLWKLTREGAESTRRHSRFGTFYETVNRHGDSMWLTTDTAQHGGSYFKMYEETSTGLRWVADLDEFGTKIADKHKSDVGAFIPWKELGR